MNRKAVTAMMLLAVLLTGCGAKNAQETVTAATGESSSASASQTSETSETSEAKT